MTLDITTDKQFLICNSEYPYELQLLKRFLTREIANAWLIKKHQPYINTERCFINEYGLVPTGLWLEVLQFNKKYNIACNLSDNFKAYINEYQMDYSKFEEWIHETFDGAKEPIYDENKKFTGLYKEFFPRDYQIKAAYSLLKYRKCCGEISTSAGKTLISFIIFKYIIDHAGSNKILYIVPSVDLATQSAEKYEAYESYLLNHKHNWSIGILKSGLKKKEKEAVETCNILFGTFQSLCKRNFEFFKAFEGCINDEAHHSSADSIKNILNKCQNLKYSIGVTGTFPKENTIENLSIQSYIGPVVYKLTAEELINKEKSATPVYIVFQLLNWATLSEKRELYYQRFQKSNNPDDMSLGTKLLRQELEFINNSYIRLKYIGDLAIRMAKNTLILFGDVKGEYGKKIADYIKDNSDKDVYYMDGSTPTENRDYFKAKCKEDTNGKTVIVGSLGTCSEGIDIPNIESIFLVNTAKSERIVRQIVGRGLRLAEAKEKAILYDFVDNLKYSEDPKRRYNENYVWQHYQQRKKIYSEQNFPTFEQKIDFK